MRPVRSRLVSRQDTSARWFASFSGCLVVAVVSGACSDVSSSDGAGGSVSRGGASGNPSAGGSVSSGGSAAGGAPSGGSTQAGGHANGGLTSDGGATSGGATSGGAASGGLSARGGTTAAGGGPSNGGAQSSGGASSGGAVANGGKPASGGGSAQGGAAALGGGPSVGGASNGPCDIYAAANTPCVAAHSTVRALYGAYTGNLYQVRRASDKTTKDVPVKDAGGFVDISVQDTFCTGTTCTISIIYDQTSNHNNLTKSPQVTYVTGAEANATDGKVTVSGHTAYGIYVTGNPNYVGKNPPITNVAYRNNSAKGLAKGDQPESMYMVLDGKRYSSVCCFDYGNAETSGRDDGDATMEAIYWGSDTQWARGGGNGPWVAGDLENGMYKGDSKNTPSNTSITGMSYVTTILKGPSGNHFGLKAGNAQSGKLEVKWDGARPAGYSPMKKQGAIILGTGGDGSPGGTGTFYEGAITSGNPPDATDDAIQANIVAAGYGH